MSRPAPDGSASRSQGGARLVMAGNEQEEASLQAAQDELAAPRRDAMQPGGEPVAGAPPPPAVGGGPAQHAPAGKRQTRKSRYAYVTWATRSKPGGRGWYGQLNATSKHPRLATPYYRTEEEAARAADR